MRSAQNFQRRDNFRDSNERQTHEIYNEILLFDRLKTFRSLLLLKSFNSTLTRRCPSTAYDNTSCRLNVPMISDRQNDRTERQNERRPETALA